MIMGKMVCTGCWTEASRGHTDEWTFIRGVWWCPQCIEAEAEDVEADEAEATDEEAEAAGAVLKVSTDGEVVKAYAPDYYGAEWVVNAIAAESWRRSTQGMPRLWAYAGVLPAELESAVDIVEPEEEFEVNAEMIEMIAEAARELQAEGLAYLDGGL